VKRNGKAGQHPPRAVAPVEEEEEEQQQEQEQEEEEEEVRNWREKCKDRRLWNEMVK
jgi:hypothetical protein